MHRIVFLHSTVLAQNDLSPSGNIKLGNQGFLGNSLYFIGWGEGHYLRAESIGNSPNGNTRLRMVLGDDWTYNQGFEIIAHRYDGLDRSLLYIPGDGSQASFYSGATFGGNVGIGTTNPTEKLSVNGNIRAKEIKVEATNWPDYVFEEDYKITSLADLEEYIKLNKHLPDMPSAKEVEQNGLALGEIVRQQQKKIEELTLYLIEKDTQMKLLIERIENLEKKIR